MWNHTATPLVPTSIDAQQIMSDDAQQTMNINAQQHVRNDDITDQCAAHASPTPGGAPPEEACIVHDTGKDDDTNNDITKDNNNTVHDKDDNDNSTVHAAGTTMQSPTQPTQPRLPPNPQAQPTPQAHTTPTPHNKGSLQVHPWAPAPRVTQDMLDKRCPGSHRATRYHRCLHELYALHGEHSRWDGLVEKRTLYTV